MVTLADGLSGGEVAGLIVAVFWGVLVCFIGYVLVKLGNVVGEAGKLVSDLYGKDVVFHGTVEGFDGGTGAAFALIPAQNATGNWIKVVQRLPVRIRLQPAELAAHPLRVGLSMTATVDLGKQAN